MITQIKLDVFTIDVSTPELEKELQKLNTQKDDVIDVNDIQMPAGLTKPKLQNELLREAVTQAFVSSGLLTEDKRDDLLKFYDLYQQVEDFAAKVEDWKTSAQIVTETGEYDTYGALKAGSKSLRFMHDSAPQRWADEIETMPDLARGVHDAIHGLTGAEETRDTTLIGSNQSSVNGDCGNYDVLVGFRYDSYHLPNELKSLVEKMAQTYLKSAEWLLQFDQAYNFDPNGDDISLLRQFDRLPGLKYIKTGAKNEHATAIQYYSCDGGF